MADTDPAGTGLRTWWWAAIATGIAGVFITLSLFLAPGEADPPPTTTTVPGATVSTTAPATVEGFVASFRVAVEAGDVAFLLERLHPVVLAAYGADACRAFIRAQVLLLENYQLAGTPRGPVTRAFTTPNGAVAVDTFEAPVSFDYQGNHYQEPALLGLHSGVMHWFAECAPTPSR